jgi:hypothetical protein
VFQNEVLKKIYGPKTKQGQEDGENCTIKRNIMCMLHHILLGLSNQGDGNVTRTGEMRNFSRKALREDMRVNGRIILKWILNNRVGRCGLDACGRGQGPVAGYCENGN